jgi:hypothetical protein
MAEKLPIVLTVANTYRLAWFHRVRLIRLAWPLAILALLMGAANAAIQPHSGDFAVALDQAQNPATIIEGIVSLIAALGFLLVVVPFKTGAYRLFLHGSDARLGYRYRREEWLYVGAGFRVVGRMILWALVWLVIVGITEFGVGGGMALFVRVFELPQWPVVLFQGIIVATGLVAYAYLVAGYCLVMPAAALGHRLAIAESVRRMRGNIWRMLAAGVLVFIPPTIVGLLAQLPALAAQGAAIAAGPMEGAIAAPTGAWAIVLQLVVAAISVVSQVIPVSLIAIVCRTLGIDFTPLPAPPP